MELAVLSSDPALLLADVLPGPRTCVPTGERVYAIGDVHGRFDLFTALIDRICRDNARRRPARVRLVLLGDLIDRGPHSAELIRRCMEYSNRFADFMVLKGNHEALMEHALKGSLSAVALWLRQGGGAALASWGVPTEIIEDGSQAELMDAARYHIEPEVPAWIGTLPLTLRVGDYLFVHAGIRPGTPLARQSPEDLMWIRGDFLNSDADHAMIVVHGHSITDDGVQMYANRIGIDTGAYRSNILTALGLDGEDRWILATDDGDTSPREDLAPEALDSRLAALFAGCQATPRDELPEKIPNRRRIVALAGLGMAGAVAIGAAAWLTRSPPPLPSSSARVAFGPATSVPAGNRRTATETDVRGPVAANASEPGTRPHSVVWVRLLVKTL